jgi:hypothetical protein
MRGIIAAAAVLVSLACASLPPFRTAVLGEHGDVRALVGEWYGTYAGPAGRSGGISFTLRASDSSATGEAVMSPDPSHGPGWPASATAPSERLERTLRTPRLEVTFVRVFGGRMVGRLEPYEDPECRCIVTTVFEGVRRGRVVEGEYRTQGADLGAPRVGRWRVERARPR